MVAALTHSWWLPPVGLWLVAEQAPAPAEVVVVLAGDFRGNRILKGAELVRQGFARKVLVSGAPEVYGEQECDLAIRFAVRHGHSEESFEAVRGAHRSTQEEAHVIAQEIARRKIRSAIVVTSSYHTARAGRIWRKTAPWLAVRMVGVADQPLARWWKSREAAKRVFDEWTKSIAFAADFYTPVPGQN